MQKVGKPAEVTIRGSKAPRSSPDLLLLPLPLLLLHLLQLPEVEFKQKIKQFFVINMSSLKALFMSNISFFLWSSEPLFFYLVFPFFCTATILFSSLTETVLFLFPFIIISESSDEVEY